MHHGFTIIIVLRSVNRVHIHWVLPPLNVVVEFTVHVGRLIKVWTCQSLFGVRITSVLCRRIFSIRIDGRRSPWAGFLHKSYEIIVAQIVVKVCIKIREKLNNQFSVKIKAKFTNDKREVSERNFLFALLIKVTVNAAYLLKLINAFLGKLRKSLLKLFYVIVTIRVNLIDRRNIIVLLIRVTDRLLSFKYCGFFLCSILLKLFHIDDRCIFWLKFALHFIRLMSFKLNATLNVLVKIYKLLESGHWHLRIFRLNSFINKTFLYSFQNLLLLKISGLKQGCCKIWKDRETDLCLHFLRELEVIFDDSHINSLQFSIVYLIYKCFVHVIDAGNHFIQNNTLCFVVCCQKLANVSLLGFLVAFFQIEWPFVSLVNFAFVNTSPVHIFRIFCDIL